MIANQSLDDGGISQPLCSRVFIVCGRNRTLEQVESMFSVCGTVIQSHLALDRSNKSRGFAFLQFEDAKDAMKAIRMFDKFELPDGHILRVSVAREKHRSAAPFTAKAWKDSTQVASRTSALETQNRQKAREAVEYRDKDCLDELLPFSSHKRAKNNGERCQKASKENRTGIAKRLNPKVSHTFPRRSMNHYSASLSSAKAAQRVSFARMTNFDRRRRGYIPQDELHQIDWKQDRDERLEVSVCRMDEVGWVLERMIKTLENGIILANQSENDTLNVYRRWNKFKEHPGNDLGHTEDVLTEDLTLFIDSVSLNSDSNKLGAGKTRSSCVMSRSDQATKRLKHESLVINRHETNSMDSNTDKSSYSRTVIHDRNLEEEHRRLQRTCSASQAPTNKHSIDKTTSKVSNFIRKARSLSDGSSSPSVYRNETEGKYPQASKQPASVNPAGVRDSCNKICSETSNSSTLFFVASYKFTDQELKAIFGAYNRLESIHRVETFGRIKTMAYISYSKSSEAQSVLDAFHEEPADRKDVTMKLTMADSKKESINRSIQVTREEQDAGDERISQTLQPNEKASNSSQWLLLLYDRCIPKAIISSRISHYEKLECVEFQGPKERKNAQNVAYVKFEDEGAARQAATDLHRSRIAHKDGNYHELQAVLVTRPNIFNNSLQPASLNYGTEYDSASTPARRVTGFGKEEADLVAVETQFAHMMRNSGGGQYFPRNTMAYGSPSHNLSDPYFDEQFPSSHSHQYSNYPPDFAPLIDYCAPIAFPMRHAFQTCGYDPYGETPCGYVDPDYDPYGQSDPGWSEGSGTQMPDGADTLDDETLDVTASTSSVLIYASGPLQLAPVAALLENFTGVLALQRESGTSFVDENGEFFPAFVVEFRDAGQAREASKELDSMTCNGQILRTQLLETCHPESSLQNGSEARNVRRNKRQRLDPRGRQQ
uniref:AlNc14C88G5591 protein n=1 Tax=Albugo laibachii Nc14 TaxID=890382 RepID=F0WG61_9STRA|nr:AlNc14C88G5591 [Albugo laibachii Nc14]|eukprot:CCA20196.1 AlNc14C88G5591 [Albugo laibachii Nc14]